MLEAYALKYIELGSDIQKIRESLIRAFDAEGRLSSADRQDLHDTLTALSQVCADLELPIAAQTVRHAEFDLPHTARELDQLIYGVFAELKARTFLFVPSHRQRFYEWDEIVSEPVKESFGESTREMREAACCYALGRYRAAVFHGMRAAEIGTRRLADELKVEVPETIEFADWQRLLLEIGKKVAALGTRPRGREREGDQVFFAQAAVQLQFFKDGWRVRMAHGRATYNEHQAKEVIDHVRAFFETLAERLKE